MLWCHRYPAPLSRNPGSRAALVSSCTPSVARPDIVDRNGTTLGMDIPSASIYAEPRRIVDLDEAIDGILAVFPDLDMLELRGRLDSDTGFAWVKRNVTPAEKDKVWAFVFRASGSGRKPDASIQTVGRAVTCWARSTSTIQVSPGLSDGSTTGPARSSCRWHRDNQR